MEGAEPAEEKETEDPKFHPVENGRLVISTHTKEIHYENASTSGKLVATPMMSVLTCKETYSSTQRIGKQESANDVKEPHKYSGGVKANREIS